MEESRISVFQCAGIQIGGPVFSVPFYFCGRLLSLYNSGLPPFQPNPSSPSISSPRYLRPHRTSSAAHILRTKMSTLSLPFQCTATTTTHTRNPGSLSKSPASLGSVKKVSKAFRLRSSSCFRAKATAVYKVKFIGPKGEENEFEAPEDTYILDAAEKAGVAGLAYSCRAGACSSCAGKLASGTVEQSEGSVLDEEQMEMGYVLPCVAYPTSDCVIHTHKEGDLY